MNSERTRLPSPRPSPIRWERESIRARSGLSKASLLNDDSQFSLSHRMGEGRGEGYPRSSASSAVKPLLVAIVGGSGSGKTWLAKKLQAALGDRAARLSLDDFYRDRS